MRSTSSSLLPRIARTRRASSTTASSPAHSSSNNRLHASGKCLQAGSEGKESERGGKDRGRMMTPSSVAPSGRDGKAGAFSEADLSRRFMNPLLTATVSLSLGRSSCPCFPSTLARAPSLSSAPLPRSPLASGERRERRRGERMPLMSLRPHSERGEQSGEKRRGSSCSRSVLCSRKERAYIVSRVTERREKPCRVSQNSARLSVERHRTGARRFCMNPLLTATVPPSLCRFSCPSSVTEPERKSCLAPWKEERLRQEKGRERREERGARGGRRERERERERACHRSPLSSNSDNGCTGPPCAT
mmetsp:Transcript_23397/g.55758  ORF Transcript_23397/g.55758 Transcript_23397/m.55758 type:complete len:304 (+) Transcript_23397:403-1314(+)